MTLIGDLIWRGAMTVAGETGNAVAIAMSWMAGGKSSKDGMASHSNRPRRGA